MEPLRIFRSAAMAVMFSIHLKNLVRAKRLAEKESSMRDFEAMLRVYFEATMMWLGKVVKIPLLSLLQDSSLDVDIRLGNSFAASSLRGFAKKFGDLLARRPTPRRTTGGSVVEPTKLLKLKVRLRGILQALCKAIEKKEVPSGILDFWRRISSDGVYFPPSYQLFPEERQCFEFDELGATRSMDTTSNDQDEGAAFSRFNVVMINFLFLRILIPHVILQPWNVGIGPKNIGKQGSANMASLATLLYFVCKQLSPLPLPSDAVLSGRRNSTLLGGNNTSENIEQVTSKPSGPEVEAGEPSTNVAPLSIGEICKRLVQEKNFPHDDIQFIQVVKEQQAALQDILQCLCLQLHSSKA